MNAKHHALNRVHWLDGAAVAAPPGYQSDPHTELDSLISTELDNCLISTELDSEISTQLDNCQISTQLDKINFT